MEDKKNPLSELMRTTMEHIKTMADANTIIGTPIHAEGVTLIPVSKMSFGVGGGVLRDIFAGDRPYIFVRHIYACASILGAVLCAAMWQFTTPEASMSLGFLTVLTVRLCSAKYHWSLPKLDAVD